MPIPEAILNQLKCCFFNDGHIAIEALLLSCGSSVCRKCVVDSKENVFQCFSCNENHKISDLIKAPVIKVAESIVKTFINDLFDYVETTLEKCSAAVKGILLKNSQLIKISKYNFKKTILGLLN
jgi:hypothetical protein